MRLDDVPKKVCVTHCGLAIYIRKYLKGKEELWKFKYCVKLRKPKGPTNIISP
jgi:hypothetical protein